MRVTSWFTDVFETSRKCMWVFHLPDRLFDSNNSAAIPALILLFQLNRKKWRKRFHLQVRWGNPTEPFQDSAVGVRKFQPPTMEIHCIVLFGVLTHRVLHDFRQNVEEEQTEEGPQQVTGAPAVPAEILQRTSELRPGGHPVSKPDRVPPAQRRGLAAGFRQEQV